MGAVSAPLGPRAPQPGWCPARFFITLTDFHGGAPIYVRPGQIAAITGHEKDSATVVLKGRESYLKVKETPQEVVSKLTEATR